MFLIRSKIGSQRFKSIQNSFQGIKTQVRDPEDIFFWENFLMKFSLFYCNHLEDEICSRLLQSPIHITDSTQNIKILYKMQRKLCLILI